jgi:hypothetical protein
LILQLYINALQNFSNTSIKRGPHVLRAMVSRFMTPRDAENLGRFIALHPARVTTFCTQVRSAVRAAARMHEPAASQLLPCLAVADAAMKTTLEACTRIAGVLVRLWMRGGGILTKAIANQPATVRRCAWTLLSHWARLALLPPQMLHTCGAIVSREPLVAAKVRRPRATSDMSLLERARRDAVHADVVAWSAKERVRPQTPETATETAAETATATDAPRFVCECEDCGAQATARFLEAPFAVWCFTLHCPCARTTPAEDFRDSAATPPVRVVAERKP